MLKRTALSLLISVCYSVRLSASIQWPSGSYGIPKATSGCPQGVEVRWKTGWRFQDTDDSHSDNQRSPEFHLDGDVSSKGVNRSFCIQADTNYDNTRPSWPPGKYCIYKKKTCPSGLRSGFVYWDDDDYGNQNGNGGTLPDGQYDTNTRIEFCCRADGNKKDPIILPGSSPFFLLAYKSAECQQVKWTLSGVEWILFDNEDDRNTDKYGGSYPYGAGTKHAHHKIHYCYYQGCNTTLQKSSGTFHSPNYPQKYPDGQYCSWRIMVSLRQLVQLKFTNFTLQGENNTDAVYVYNGENETGEVIGVFYGGHPPPQKGIKSSSNNLFVIFKSDVNGSFTGFNAFYSAVNYSEPTSTATSTAAVTSPNKKPSESGLNTLAPSEPSTNVDTSKEGLHGERNGSRSLGVKVAAIVIPLVGCVVAAIFVGGLLYFRRGEFRTTAYSETNSITVKCSPVALQSPKNGHSTWVEQEMALKVRVNLYRKRIREEKDSTKVLYQTSESLPPPLIDNPSYETSMISENILYSSPEDQQAIYTEIERDTNKYDPHNETENPLYEAMTEETTETNPIYDSTP